MKCVQFTEVRIFDGSSVLWCSTILFRPGSFKFSHKRNGDLHIMISLLNPPNEKVLPPDTFSNMFGLKYLLH